MSIRIRLLIDNIDRTSALLAREWSIDLNLGADLNSCQLVLRDPDNQIEVLRGQELVIEEWSDPATRHFAGIVTEVDRRSDGLGRRIMVRAEDWKILLERSHVQQRYRSQTAKQIIQDAFTEAGLTEFNTALNVEDGATVGFVLYDEVDLRTIVGELAENNGYAWDVDPFKFLIFRPPEVEDSGIDFTDDGSGSSYEGLVDALPPEGLLNHIVIQGGEYQIDSTDHTQGFSADGKQKLFDIGKWKEPAGQTFITVQRGTTASSTFAEQTVDILKDGVFTNADVAWSPRGGRLLWNTAPPDINEAFRITGRRIADLRYEEFDSISISALGRQYTEIIKDRSITDEAEATLHAKARLQEARRGRTVGFSTIVDGVAPGKTFDLANTPLGINETFICTQLVIRLLGGQVARYEVTGEAISDTLPEWEKVS
jgi:hypothetical protein